MIDELRDGRIEELEHQVREHAEHDDGDEERRPGDPLDEAHVVDVGVAIVIVIGVMVIGVMVIGVMVIGVMVIGVGGGAQRVGDVTVTM